MYRGGPLGSLKTASHTRPDGKTRWGYAKCQQHHRQGDFHGVYTILARLPSHCSGYLGGRPIQGPYPFIKYGCNGCLPLRHTPAVSCGILCLRHPIVSRAQLHNCLHWYSATNGMDVLTQVFLCIFINTYRCGEWTSAHVASSTWIQDHLQDLRYRPRPALNPG